MLNKVQKSKSIQTVVPNTVKAGDLVILGDLKGVAVTDSDGVEPIVVELTGVFTLPKATGAGTALTVGGKVYYDDDDDVVTAVATDNTEIGVAFAAAAVGDTTAVVALKNGL